MILRSSSEKITFLVDTIHSIGYEHKGASIACHKLAQELAIRGHFVYVFNPPIYPHENIKVIHTQKMDFDGGWWSKFYWEPFNYDINRTVSVYSHITWGNPFNTIHNTRWILHHYEPEQWETYNETDLICNYSSFDIPKGTKQSILTVFDYGFEKYYNKNNPNRKGFAHIVHKKTPEWGLEFLKKFGSTEIPHYNGQKKLDYLVDEFNKYEYLLTFDDKTYYTSIAGLCGTKSIILNEDKSISPSEFRINNPIQLCGVAYGMNDLDWANQTINLVRDNLIDLEKKDKKTIDNFVQYWEEKVR